MTTETKNTETLTERARALYAERFGEKAAARNEPRVAALADVLAEARGAEVTLHEYDVDMRGAVIYRPNKLGGFSGRSLPLSLVPCNEGERVSGSALAHARLPLDVVLYDTAARMARCADEVAPRPEAPHIPQVGKLLAQDAGRVALHGLDDFGSRNVGSDTDKQMHMVRHDLHCSDFAAQGFDTLGEQLVKPLTHRADQDFAAVLRTPDQMVINRENSVALMRVLCHRLTLIRRGLLYAVLQDGGGESFQGHCPSAREFFQPLGSGEVNVDIDLVEAFGGGFGLSARPLLSPAERTLCFGHQNPWPPIAAARALLS